MFRRADSPDSSRSLLLRGLESQTRYEITSLDMPERSVLTGAELSGRGLAVTLTNQPAAAELTYRRVDALE